MHWPRTLDWTGGFIYETGSVCFKLLETSSSWSYVCNKNLDAWSPCHPGRVSDSGHPSVDTLGNPRTTKNKCGKTFHKRSESPITLPKHTVLSISSLTTSKSLIHAYRCKRDSQVLAICSTLCSARLEQPSCSFLEVRTRPMEIIRLFEGQCLR